jgi:hypothetical protein
MVTIFEGTRCVLRPSLVDAPALGPAASISASTDSPLVTSEGTGPSTAAATSR